MEENYNTSNFLKEWTKVVSILSIIFALSGCLHSSWDNQQVSSDTTVKKEWSPDTIIHNLNDQPDCLFKDVLFESLEWQVFDE